MRAPTHNVSLIASSMLVGFLSVSNVYAGEAASVSDYQVGSKNTWYMGLGGGTTWISLPSSTNVINGSGATPPANVDQYTIKNPSADIVQFVAGYRWYQDKAFLPYYAAFFQYRHYVNTDIKGTVSQYSSPTFLNYNYRLSYEADLFTLSGKVDLANYKHFLPYVSAGVGVIYNHLNSYSESALAGVTARINPNYNGITTAKLAGTLGGGIDYIITDNVWATLGYEHVFQGSLKTGPGAGSWSNTALNIGNAKMDTIFINFSANFPQVIRR